jgi:hypothetical protein
MEENKVKLQVRASEVGFLGGRGVPGCSTTRRRWAGRTWSHPQRTEYPRMPASERVVFPPHLVRVDHLAACMNYSHPLSRRRRRHRAVARVCGGRGWGFCGSMGLGSESVEEGEVASGRVSEARGSPSPEPADDIEERRRTGRCCQERDLVWGSTWR